MMILLLFLSMFTWAQTSTTDGVLINADSMYRDSVSQTVTLDGHVQVVFQGQNLNCDHAVLDLKKQTVDATGNVVLNTPKIHLEATHAVFNYKSNTGLVDNGYVQSGQVVFEGRRIQKTGEDTFIAYDGEYTACTTCPAGWSFAGRRIRAQLGGYAFISRPIFKVAGLPIPILLPLIVPLKSSRQSGVLQPTGGQTHRGGWEISEPYFWAISKSQDLTLTPTWYEYLGIKGQADYRYVLSPESRGRLQVAGLRDRAFNKELSAHSGFYRWALQFKDYYELPDNFVQRADIRSISDLHYLKDFPLEVPGYEDPAIENTVSITKSSEDYLFSAEANYNINLLKSDPLADNKDAVHKIPELHYSLKEGRIGGSYGPLFKLDADYVNFTRDSYSYDDLYTTTDSSGQSERKASSQRDGKFDPATDLIRTGQRLDVKPVISYPIEIKNRFRLVPTLIYRETQYRFNTDEVDTSADFGPTAARRYVQADIGLSTEFSRLFGDLKNPQGNRWKHSIEPEISYSTIPWIRQPNHAFFGNFHGQQQNRALEPVSDQDLNGINKLQFDYDDRVFERRLMDFAVTNKIFRKRWFNGEPSYQEVMLLRLSQSYDLNEASSDDRPQPWSTVNALLDMHFDHFETNTVASYNPYARVTNTSSRIRVMNDAKNFVELTYNHTYLIDENNVVEPDSETEDVGLGFGFQSRYLDMGTKLNYSNITRRVNSWQYEAIITPPGNCWSIVLQHQKIIGGDTQFHASFKFKFGGEEPSSTTL